VPGHFVAKTVTPVPGFYGKILSHGDFVSRHLPHYFIDAWDQWLQASIRRGEELLSAEWLDCYLRAPIWRFALGPGVIGETPWFGVLMPSVDKVGRHFPFTIAMAVPPGSSLNETLALCDRWFTRVEALALSTLDREFNLEYFASELQNVPLPIWVAPRRIRNFLERNIKPPSGMVWLLKTDLERLNAPPFQMTFPIWSNFNFAGHSLWSSYGTDDIYPALAMSATLPSRDNFPALIKGRWEQFGWRVER
jgi:type VI secretion system protein ImpM